MGQSASQAAAFYRDVASSRTLFTVEDDHGIPAPVTRTGRRSMPFWSTRSRVERIIRTVPAYSAFRILVVAWPDFVDVWVPDIETSGLLVGVNWSGKHATGYDMEARDVLANVEHAISLSGGS